MSACPQCDTEHAADVACPNEAGLAVIEAEVTDAPPTDAPYAPGEQLGSYRLLELLGEGGMGFVYLAEHSRLGRKVALKILRPEYGGNPSAVRRFFGEARAVNQINHENIVEITDFIEEEGEEKYYIMELLRGESLQDLLVGERFVPVGRALGIASQVAGALAAVHAAGIVHRDLKPDNIFLTTRSGQKDFVKLLDFGVAKLGDLGGEANVSQTAAGAIIGTPEYMSPEQAAGKKVDHRTDVYALGIILFEMVTGTKAFVGKSFGEMVIKHMTVPPPKPSKVDGLAQAIPSELEGLILSCLAKDPEKRPQSMDEVRSVLESIASTGAHALETFVPAPPPRGRKLAMLGAAAAAIALVGAVWASGGAPEEPTEVAAIDVAAQEPPQAPEPVEIEVAFVSSPEGASVSEKGSEDVLGVTPFSLTVERRDASQTYVLELDGHFPVEQDVSLAANTRVQVTLAEKPVARVTPRQRTRPSRPRTPAAKSPPKKQKKRFDRGAVIDPFAED